MSMQQVAVDPARIYSHFSRRNAIGRSLSFKTPRSKSDKAAQRGSGDELLVGRVALVVVVLISFIHVMADFIGPGVQHDIAASEANNSQPADFLLVIPLLPVLDHG